MGAKMFDVNLLVQAGINPKNGCPIKMDDLFDCQSKAAIKKFLRIIDEQDAISRYEWAIPEKLKLTSLELERMIYYKGQLSFFEFNDEFYVMPYALTGTIDLYGRFNEIHPVPMVSGTSEEPKKDNKGYKEYQNQVALLSQLKLQPQYIPVIGEVDKSKVCVLLHDYTKQMSQTIVSRQLINDPILDIEADIIPYLDTKMILGTGIKGVRVQSGDEYNSVLYGAKVVKKCAQSGVPWNPIVGNVEFQELASGATGTTLGDYFQTLQSLDNFRLKGYGISNGGLFEKKAHLLGAEQEVNDSNSSSPMIDGLEIRQHFCDVVNSIWNCGIAVRKRKIAQIEDNTSSENNEEEVIIEEGEQENA